MPFTGTKMMMHFFHFASVIYQACNIIWLSTNHEINRWTRNKNNSKQRNKEGYSPLFSNYFRPPFDWHSVPSRIPLFLKAPLPQCSKSLGTRCWALSYFASEAKKLISVPQAQWWSLTSRCANTRLRCFFDFLFYINAFGIESDSSWQEHRLDLRFLTRR